MADAALPAGPAKPRLALRIKSTLRDWAAKPQPISPLEKYVPAGLKGQWQVFPFTLPRLAEPVNSAFLKAAGAEFYGMALFLFISIGSVVFSCTEADANKVNELGESTCLINSGRVIPIAITFGFTLFTMVYATASYSGGHLNPAITLGALAAGKVSCLRALTYIGAQLAGGLLGVACVRAIDPTLYAQAGGGANLLSSAVSAGGGLLLEFLLTFALMFVVLAATDTTRYRGVAHLPVLAPLAIGMTVLVAHLAAVPIDGCSLNPARSFATAVMSGTWTSQWLFWAGPILGALVATWVYELGFRPDWDPVMAMDEGGGAGAAVQGAGGGGGGAGPSGGVPKPALYPPGASVV